MYIYHSDYLSIFYILQLRKFSWWTKMYSLSIINGSVLKWCALKCPICLRSNTILVNLEPVVLFYLSQLCCSEHRLAATLLHHTRSYYNYNSECLLVPSFGATGYYVSYQRQDLGAPTVWEDCGRGQHYCHTEWSGTRNNLQDQSVVCRWDISQSWGKGDECDSNGKWYV